MARLSAKARGVGCMPSPRRSNNLSCVSRRRRLSVALIAGWLRPIFCPARVTWRSAISASNATSRLRSTTARFTVVAPLTPSSPPRVNVNARNLWMIARSRRVGFRAVNLLSRRLDIQTLDLDYQIIRLAHTKGRSNNSRWPTQMRPSCLDGTHDLLSETRAAEGETPCRRSTGYGVSCSLAVSRLSRPPALSIIPHSRRTSWSSAL